MKLHSEFGSDCLLHLFLPFDENMIAIGLCSSWFGDNWSQTEFPQQAQLIIRMGTDQLKISDGHRPI